MRRMGHTLEYVRTIAEVAASENGSASLGTLDPGFYQINIWCPGEEQGYAAFLELSDDFVEQYGVSITMPNSNGAFVTGIAKMEYFSLVSREAVLRMYFNDEQVIWLNDDEAKIINIYRLK